MKVFLRFAGGFITALLSIAVGCGGGGSNSTPTPPAKATITISPSGTVVYVTSNYTRQFSATITGITNTTPKWSFLELNANFQVDQTGLVTGPTQAYPQGMNLQVTAADGTVKNQYIESAPPVNPTLNSNGLVIGTSSSPSVIRFGMTPLSQIDQSTVQWVTSGMTTSNSDGGNGLSFTAPWGSNCSAQVTLKDKGGISYQSNIFNFSMPSTDPTPLTDYSITPPTTVFIRDGGNTSINCSIQPITGSTGIIFLQASGGTYPATISTSNSKEVDVPGVLNANLMLFTSTTINNSTPQATNISITGISTGLSNRIASFNITRNPNSYPDFGIVGTNPISLNISKGNSGNCTLLASAINGFNKAINISLVEVISSNKPVALNGFSINPTSILAGSLSTIVTINIDSNVPSGTYYLNIQGDDGLYKHLWSQTVVVN